jgi:hypothetical protein
MKNLKLLVSELVLTITHYTHDTHYTHEFQCIIKI